MSYVDVPHHSVERFSIELGEACKTIHNMEFVWVTAGEVPDSHGLPFDIVTHDNADVDLMIGAVPDPLTWGLEEEFFYNSPYIPFTHEDSVPNYGNIPFAVSWMHNKIGTIAENTGLDVYQWHPGLKTNVDPTFVNWDMFTILRPEAIPDNENSCRFTAKLIQFMKYCQERGVRVMCASSGTLGSTAYGWKLLEELHKIHGIQSVGRIPYNRFRSVLAASSVYFDPLPHTPYYPPAEAIMVGDGRVVRGKGIDEYLPNSPYLIEDILDLDMGEWWEVLNMAMWNVSPVKWSETQDYVRELFNVESQCKKLSDILKEGISR